MEYYLPYIYYKFIHLTDLSIYIGVVFVVIIVLKYDDT